MRHESIFNGGEVMRNYFRDEFFVVGKISNRTNFFPPSDHQALTIVNL
jgi:hypothetical protein